MFELNPKYLETRIAFDIFKPEKLSGLDVNNSVSLVIATALSELAFAEQTGRQQGKLRQRLCELSGIPLDRYVDVIDFKPQISMDDHSYSQTVFLRPIVSGTEPENMLPPFISWGAAVREQPGIFIARPALIKDLRDQRAYMTLEHQLQHGSYEQLLTQTLPTLLFTPDEELPVEVYLMAFAEEYSVGNRFCIRTAEAMKNREYI